MEPRLLPRAMEEVASKTEALFRALLSGLCIMCEICDDLQVGVAAIAGHREVKMNGSSLRPLREGSTRVNDLAAACLKASGVLKSVCVLNTSGEGSDRVIYASPSVSVTSMDPPTGQARASFHLERDTLDFQELVVVLQMALETVCSFAKPQASITMRGSCLTEEERTTWCEELGVDDAAGPVAFHASSEQLTSLPWFAERAQRMLIADRSVVGDTCIVGVAETNLIDSTGGCQAAALWARPAVGEAPAGSPLGAPPTDDSASPPSVCLAAVFIDHIPCTREALPPWVEPALASIKWKVFGLELTAMDTARGHFGVLELRLRARGGSAGSLEAIVLHVVSDGKGRPLKAKRGAKALRDAAEGALEAVKRTCPGALGSSHDVQLSLAVPVVAAEIASLTARSRSAAVEWAARAALGPGRVGSPETRRQIEALLFRAAQENSTGAGSS